MPRPRIYDDDLRSALLESAARAIAEQGVDGLVLRRVAADAKTSTSAVYALYGGKPGLVEAVVELGVRGLAEAMSLPDTDDPVADLRAVGMAYREWALDHPDLYIVMFGSQMVSAPGREQAVRSLLEFGMTPLRRQTERLRACGLLDVDDLRAVTVSLWAAVHGIVILERGTFQHLLPRETRDAIYASHLHHMLHGWLTGPARVRGPAGPVAGALTASATPTAD